MESDFKQLGRTTVLDLFNRALSKKVLEYGKMHKPFDIPCARLAFRDKLANAEKESERVHGYVREEDLKIEIGDLDQYGDEDRFEFVEDQEDYQDKVIEGSRTQVILGHTLTYVCKARGHKISVFVPIADYNKGKTESKKEKPKEKNKKEE